MANALEQLKPVIRIALINKNSDSHNEFGRGVAFLCKGVQELGSLNAAAKSMGMAYSKAWRIIKETETALGFMLLDRDGAHGSMLTPEGKELLEVYGKLDKTIQDFADKEVAKLFSK